MIEAFTQALERLSKGDKKLFRHARGRDFCPLEPEVTGVSFSRDDRPEIVPHLQETFTKVLERVRSLQGASKRTRIWTWSLEA